MGTQAVPCYTLLAPDKYRERGERMAYLPRVCITSSPDSKESKDDESTNPAVHIVSLQIGN